MKPIVPVKEHSIRTRIKTIAVIWIATTTYVREYSIRTRIKTLIVNGIECSVSSQRVFH